MHPRYLFRLAATGVLLASGAHANGASVKFQHTGATVEWIVPNGITNVTVEALGASGGSIVNQWGGYLFYGGLGGRVQGNLAVAPGQTLFITVGGLGQNGYSMGAGGGFNGGAPGGAYGGGGGGATDIRVGGVGLSSRVVIAGGGGGAANSAIALGDYSGGRNGNGGGAGPLTSSLGTGAGGLYSGGGGGHYGGTSGGPSTHAGGGSSYVDPSQTSEVLVENGISGTPQLHSRPGELLISYADDTTPPVITLNGSSPQTVYRGTTFTDLGATVTDDFDATRTITGSGTVNTSTVGSYTLTYSAQDEVGNVATPVTRTVEVVLDPNGDEDKDGLNNTEEASLGTNPYERDTDGDGVTDLREVEDGTDPLDPASFDPLSKGLVAHFDGESAVDRLRNLPNLNAKGNASMGLGVIGSSFIFDGVGAGYTLPDVEELKLSSFTVSLWFRWAGYRGETEMLVFRGGVRGGFDPFFLQVLGDGVLLAALNHGGIMQASYLHSAETVSIDTWYMAVVTFDENTKAFRLYVNGRSSDAATSTSSMDRDLEPWEDPGWGIGNVSGNNWYNYPYNGSLDELRFYNRALGADEVALLFAQDKYSGFSLEGAVTKSPFDPATAANWGAGGATWNVDTSVTHDGVDSVKAQTTDGQSSYREYTVTGPAVADFWWKVSSEELYDTFSYSLNGVNQQTISGEVHWTYRTLTLPEGVHTIRWTYAKDESGAVGQDAGWLDDFVVYPATAALQVSDGSTALDGEATVDFGSADTGSTGFTRSLTFANEGYVPLEVQLSLPDGSPFTFDDGAATYALLLGRGESVDVPIVLSTAGAGTKTAQLTISAPDSTVAPPSVTLTGYVRGPDIGLAQGATALTSGQTFDMGLAPRTVEFTIRNNGNVGDLVIAGISATGNFQITQQPAATIPPQTSTTFKVLAQSIASGVQAGSISITSNAANLAEFSLPLSSKSLIAFPDGVTDGSMATSGTGGAAGWDFGTTVLPSGQSGSALKTGATPNSGGSVLEFTTQTAGVVSWTWKVSTQENFDWLLCEVDGQEVAGISTKNGVWQTQVVQVPAGANVRWVYRKDASGNIGEDAGYLADVEFRSFAANQSFSQWAQTHGIYDPQQRMPESGLPAMFGWLGGFRVDGDAIPDIIEAQGRLTYRYPVSKTADGTQQILYSPDMSSWTARRISQRIVSEDADRMVIEATAPSGTKGFFKVVGSGDMQRVMVRVQGGTLPQTSQLAGTTVSTFQIGKTEVTWAEWQEVRSWAVANGYSFNTGYNTNNDIGSGNSGNHPVTAINWYDAVTWCNAKSEKEGLTPVYWLNGIVYRYGPHRPTVNASANGYRLPTEEEWEWAVRGGMSSKGYHYSGSNYLDAVGWYSANSEGSIMAVGTKSANELGLYDMSGNVWEMVENLWVGALSGARGGSWGSTEQSCAVKGGRYIDDSYNRSVQIGFRLARNAED